MRSREVDGRIILEDDPEKFFGRRAWDVSDADMWRWRAACEAARAYEKE